jgi:hypothetical protein
VPRRGVTTRVSPGEYSCGQLVCSQVVRQLDTPTAKPVGFTARSGSVTTSARRARPALVLDSTSTVLRPLCPEVVLYSWRTPIGQRHSGMPEQQFVARSVGTASSPSPGEPAGASGMWLQWGDCCRRFPAASVRGSFSFGCWIVPSRVMRPDVSETYTGRLGRAPCGRSQSSSASRQGQAQEFTLGYMTTSVCHSKMR